MADVTMSLQLPTTSSYSAPATDMRTDSTTNFDSILFADMNNDPMICDESAILSETEIESMINDILAHMEEPNDSDRNSDINLEEMFGELPIESATMVAPDGQNVSREANFEGSALGVITCDEIPIQPVSSAHLTAAEHTPGTFQAQDDISLAGCTTSEREAASSPFLEPCHATPFRDIEDIQNGNWPISRILQLRRTQSDTMEAQVAWEPVTLPLDEAFAPEWEEGSLWQIEKNLVQVTWESSWTKLELVSMHVPVLDRFVDIVERSEKLRRKQFIQSRRLQRLSRAKHRNSGRELRVSKKGKALEKRRRDLDALVLATNRALSDSKSTLAGNSK